MLFGISPSTSRTPKFWHTYVITYGDFMVIVKPCYNYSKGHLQKSIFPEILGAPWKEQCYWFVCGAPCINHFQNVNFSYSGCFILFSHYSPKLYVSESFILEFSGAPYEGRSFIAGSFQLNSSNPCQVKKFKILEYSPFPTPIENRKFQNFQLHSLIGSDFMVISKIFPAEFEDKMWLEAFSGYT